MQIELWDEFAGLERRMDELLWSFFGPKARVTFPALRSRVLRGRFVPVTDMFERGGDLVLRVELPGVDPTKDVTVSVEDGELVIHGERKQHEEVEEEAYYRMEASYGDFERRMPIPEGVDEGRIKAEYTDGVLEVVIPGAAKAVKAPTAKAIPIQTPKITKAA